MDSLDNQPVNIFLNGSSRESVAKNATEYEKYIEGNGGIIEPKHFLKEMEFSESIKSILGPVRPSARKNSKILKKQFTKNGLNKANTSFVPECEDIMDEHVKNYTEKKYTNADIGFTRLKDSNPDYVPDIENSEQKLREKKGVHEIPKEEFKRLTTKMFPKWSNESKEKESSKIASFMKGLKPRKVYTEKEIKDYCKTIILQNDTLHGKVNQLSEDNHELNSRIEELEEDEGKHSTTNSNLKNMCKNMNIIDQNRDNNLQMLEKNYFQTKNNYGRFNRKAIIHTKVLYALLAVYLSITMYYGNLYSLVEILPLMMIVFAFVESFRLNVVELVDTIDEKQYDKNKKEIELIMKGQDFIYELLENM